MKKDLSIFLVHYKSPELGEAWQDFFGNESAVSIVEGDLFDVHADAIVSPGNSFGFMDGGLDLLISKRLSWEVQTELRNYIQSTELKELLVGQTYCVSAKERMVICAPTMRIPTNEGIPASVNAYLSMKGILIEVLNNDAIKSVAIPGLCTGTGKMHPHVAAKQMWAAYNEVVLGNQPEFPLFMDAVKYHNNLKRQ